MSITSTFIRNTLAVFVILLLFPAGFVSAQATADDVNELREQLKEDLAELEQEIEVQLQILAEKQRETSSLERDVAVFNAQIRQAELSIRARNIRINRLANEIRGKESDIDSLSAKMEREKESLAQLMRKARAMDDVSLIEIVLSNEDISEFFSDIESFAAINNSLKQSFAHIEETKKEAKQERDNLAVKRAEEQELRYFQELQKQQLEQAKAEKRELLEITKGQEDRYREIVEAKERSAAEIRSELFALRGSDAIPFEEAMKYANQASARTGVRPALILGVIAQESNLGENVGQCILTNEPTKGDGRGVNTGRLFRNVMKPDRDVDIFFNILDRLGLSPNGMVVSCPPGYGYGGAMGPAQFIPSTWVLYEDKVASVLGVAVANPWSPRDAFTASALLLRDNGADAGTYYSERLAALRYFAGWRNATNPSYAFYGDGVMRLAAKYQKQIDILSRN